MDQREVCKQSLFDILEETNENPESFLWSDSPLLTTLDTKECIYSGTLTSYHADSKWQKNHFVLTPDRLFMCEDSKMVEGLYHAKAALPLRNPRIKVLPLGFRLIGYKACYEYFCESVSDLEIWLDKLRQACILCNITELYSFGELLGSGSFAKVHLCSLISDPDAQFAIKSVEKTKILEHPRNAQSIQREIKILRKMNHPGIIRLFEVYESETCIHLVLEYLKGGELLTHLRNKGAYSERDASSLIKCVLEALEYCHSKGIVHRDLKPENLIIV